MSEPGVLQQADAAAPGSAAPAPALPDINAETYPFELVQHLLDQAAHFNLFSEPGGASGGEVLDPGSGGVTGVRVRETLRRFEVRVEAPGRAEGLRARNLVGEAAGTFEHRWMLIPGDFQAAPGKEPPPTAFDASRSQRFAMLDGICRFGDGRDGFRGFGTGTTWPAAGGRVLAAAVGNVMEGFGKLAGLGGTYTYCGTLDPGRGFTGNLLLRVMDPRGELHADGGLPPLEATADPEPGITWLVLRGQKRDRNQRTEYRFGPGGAVVGLDVEQDLRLFDVDFSDRARGGLRSTRSVGPVAGRMTARIAFNFLDPGAPGTAAAPIPFQSYNEYTIFDRDGREIGGFAADGSEGRTFNMEVPGAPGQRGLRFGGFGPILDGRGWFEGISGLMTDNSVVGIAPHALATLYVLRIEDPEGRYRLTPRGAR